MPRQRFVLRKQKLQRKQSAVEVGNDEVVVDHRYAFKQPVRVPLANVGGVIRLRQVESLDLVTKRAVRVLDLPSAQYTDPNVELLFRQSVRVPKFKLGQQQLLAISGKERRRGVDLDGFTFTADDPDALVRALENRGVTRFENEIDAWREVFGEATGHLVQQRIAEEEREVRKTRWQMLGWSVLTLVLVVVRFVIPEDGDVSIPVATMVRIVIGAFAAAGLAGAVASRLARTSQREPVARPVADRLDWRKSAGLVIGPLAFVAIVWGGIYAAGYIGPPLPRHLTMGALLGGPLGGFIGAQFGSTRSRSDTAGI